MLTEILDVLESGTAAAELESETLDFKQESATIKETLTILSDAVVCLANAHGGLIVLGAADKPSSRGSFLGVDEG